MNKTISIHLGGSVFNIEEGAYHSLRVYLEKIKANFLGDPAADEIMNDIEVRIAELFTERMGNRRNVILAPDVDEVIAIMGKPEDYSTGEAPKSSASQDRQEDYSHVRNKQRRLYRDEDDKIIGGVCAGLSHYFGVDPIMIRLAVAIIFFVSFGTAFIGYLLFWGLVPKAETTAEKLQMRGEPVNINNISRMVNDEAKAAGERLSSSGRQFADSVRNNVSGVGSGAARVLSVIFGLFLTMMGLGLMIGMLSILVVSDFDFFGFGSDGYDIINTLVYGNDGTMALLTFGVALAMGAPAVALIYSGLKLLTGSRQKIKGLSLALVSLFIVGVIICFYGGMRTAKEFKSDAESTRTILLEEQAGDTLYLNMIPDSMFATSRDRHSDFSDLVRITDSLHYYGEPVTISFEPSRDSVFKIEVYKRANGYNKDFAAQLMRNMNYQFDLQGNQLALGGYFTTPKSDLYRGQFVETIIHVPVGKYVSFGPRVGGYSWEGHDGEVKKMLSDGFMDSDDDEHDREARHIERVTRGKVIINDDSIIVKTEDGEIKVKND